MSKQHPPLRDTLRIPVFLSAVLLFAALAWASDPPWLGKPYQQWDDQDIQRIFTDSPWARVTPVIRNWAPLSSDELPNLIAGGDRGLPSNPSENSGGELNFFVFWASSRVVRGASARRAVLHGPKKDIDIEKYANAPQAEYQIVVQSADMTPFFRQKEQFIRELIGQILNAKGATDQLKDLRQKLSTAICDLEDGTRKQNGALIEAMAKTLQDLVKA